MSILNFFTLKNIVPSENSELADIVGPSALKNANEVVSEIIGSPSNYACKSTAKNPASTKRGTYLAYTPQHRAKIGKYCSQNGPAATVRKFSGKFPILAESTIRSIKKSYEASFNPSKSLLSRMNFVKRRESTACKNDKVENFDKLNEEYLEYH